MKKVILYFCLTIVGTTSTAQNNSYFNEFFDNAHYNSAYNTLQQGLKVSFLGYKNLNSPYTPGYFCINTSYTNKSNLNFGTRLINKSFQFQSFYQGDIIVGHRVALTQDDSLALSLNVGGATNSFDNSYMNQYTEVDPYIDVVTRSYFTSGAGILYTHKNNLEIGISAPILATSVHGMKPVSFSTLAYNFHDNNFMFRPQVMFNVNYYSNFFDFSGMLTYQNKIWGKVAYNTLQSSMYGIGVHLKLVDIGYGFKLNSDLYGAALPNIHMLNIAIRH